MPNKLSNILIVCCAMFCASFKIALRDPPRVQVVLAFSLAGHYENPTTFAVCRVTEGKITKFSPISKAVFVSIALGNAPHEANATGENLFAKYDIDMCQAAEIGQECEILENLWKLRFAEKPNVYENTEPGWANNKYSPSDRQMSILAQYGIKNINGVAFGDKAFELIKNTADPSWVASYR